MLRSGLPVLFFLVLSLKPLQVRAQKTGTLREEDQEAALENLAEVQEQTTEDDEDLQQLMSYGREPLDLNQATPQEMRIFPFLSPVQITSFIQYRQLLGPLVSIYELQAIPGFDLLLIRRLLPYVKVGTGGDLRIHYTAKQLLDKGTKSLLLRYGRTLEKSRGYRVPGTADNGAAHSHYLGSPDKMMLRYRYQFSRHLSYGVTAEKDAGETLFGKSGGSGFDFYSAHFFLEDRGILKSLALGDFVVNMGQGLINWQSLAFKKSALVMSTERLAPLLKPYTSSGEIYFYRGAGATFKIDDHLEATAFISYRPMDANILQSDSLSGEEKFFSSLQSSGYHRTLGELSDRGSVKQVSAGGNLTYRRRSWHVGINGIRHHFSGYFEPKETLENLFDFRGSTLCSVSLDYSRTFHNLHFFGETAWSGKGGWATTNGLLLSLDPRVDWAIQYRHFGRRYSSLYGNAFSESSRPVNENGIYNGVVVKLTREFQLQGYADLFQYPWLHYRVQKPSYGHDYLLQLNWQYKKAGSAYVRLQQENKPLNHSGDAPVDPVVQTSRWRCTLQGAFHPPQGVFTFRTRGAWVRYRLEGEGWKHGWLVYQDVIAKVSSKISGDVRIAWFDTDDYDTRIYTFERNVRFAYAIPFFYRKGFRWYVNTHVKLGRREDLWIRFARSSYPGNKSIGSGLDEISGPHKTSFTLQILWKLDKNK